MSRLPQLFKDTKKPEKFKKYLSNPNKNTGKTKKIPKIMATKLPHMKDSSLIHFFQALFKKICIFLFALLYHTATHLAILISPVSKTLKFFFNTLSFNIAFKNKFLQKIHARARHIFVAYSPSKAAGKKNSPLHSTDDALKNTFHPAALAPRTAKIIENNSASEAMMRPSTPPHDQQAVAVTKLTQHPLLSTHVIASSLKKTEQKKSSKNLTPKAGKVIAAPAPSTKKRIPPLSSCRVLHQLEEEAKKLSLLSSISFLILYHVLQSNLGKKNYFVASSSAESEVSSPAGRFEKNAPRSYGLKIIWILLKEYSLLNSQPSNKAYSARAAIVPPQLCMTTPSQRLSEEGREGIVAKTKSENQPKFATKLLVQFGTLSQYSSFPLASAADKPESNLSVDLLISPPPPLL